MLLAKLFFSPIFALWLPSPIFLNIWVDVFIQSHSNFFKFTYSKNYFPKKKVKDINGCRQKWMKKLDECRWKAYMKFHENMDGC